MSQGEGGGRPPKYKTPEQMQAVVDKYFTDCRYNTMLMAGIDTESAFGDDYVPDSYDEHPTVSGLALALDLVRQSLINYEGNAKFLDTIKRAKGRVEAHIEQRLYHGHAVGCIFNLKNNFNWKDRTEVEQFGEIEIITNDKYSSDVEKT
jgi:hypothetical protein